MKKHIYIIVVIMFLLVTIYVWNLLKIYSYEIEEKENVRIVNELFKEQKDSYDNAIISSTENYPQETTDSTLYHDKSYKKDDENGDVSNDNLIQDLSNEIDCTISIPDINLEKIVYTGKQREQYLESYDLVTASPDMKYLNGGNYIICGHSSRIYGHSLNRLKEIEVGDEVYINSNHLTDVYKVVSVSYEYMKNTSEFCKQTQECELTIISCAKYVEDDTYIVIKCKKN